MTQINQQGHLNAYHFTGGVVEVGWADMIKLKRAALARVAASGLMLATIGTTQASAKVFNFSFIEGLDSFGFQIDDTTAARDSDSGVYTRLLSFNGYRNGAAVDFNGFGGISFYNTDYTAGNLGGLNLQFNDNDSTFSYGGQQLYSGSEGAPSFTVGTSSIQRFGAGVPTTLKISSAGGPGAPAPEVGIGLLSALVAGLGLALTRLRSNPLPSLLRSQRAAFA